MTDETISEISNQIFLKRIKIINLTNAGGLGCKNEEMRYDYQ